MKKIIVSISVLILTVCFVACFEDKGSYDCVDREMITIENIQDSYSVIQFTDKLTILPEVTSSWPDAEFEYAYWVYDKGQGSQTPDTISVGQKDLVDYVVGLESKEYQLIFMATNVKTGIKAFKEATLNVTTSSNHGWYILKSLEGGKCDMDYYNIDGEGADNVLLASCNRQLEGDRAERLTVGNNYVDPNDSKNGVFQKTTVLFPVTDRDAVSVRLSTGKIINDFSELFQETPAVSAPGMAFASSMAQFILNDGKAYYFWPYTSSLSKFSVELARNSTFDSYHLSKYLMYATPNSIGFDETTSSFVLIPGNGTMLMSAVDAKDTEVKANNSQMNLLWAGSKGLYDSEHYALMQDKNDLSQKFLAYVTCLGNSFSIKRDNLAASDPAFDATLFTLNHSSAKVLYFVNGREVYSRSIAATPGINSKLDIVVPEGEVTFIKHMPYSVYNKPEESFDYLLIGTVNGGRYEVGCYQLDAGGRPVGQEPSRRFVGEGTVGDVTFVFPNVQSTTFVPSY